MSLPAIIYLQWLACDMLLFIYAVVVRSDVIDWVLLMICIVEILFLLLFVKRIIPSSCNYFTFMSKFYIA